MQYLDAFLTAVTIILRIFGISGVMERYWEGRAEKRKAQAVANAPETREELETALKDHDL